MKKKINKQLISISVLSQSKMFHISHNQSITRSFINKQETGKGVEPPQAVPLWVWLTPAGLQGATLYIYSQRFKVATSTVMSRFTLCGDIITPQNFQLQFLFNQIVSFQSHWHFPSEFHIFKDPCLNF